MKAIVFHGVGDIRLEDVPEPELEQPTDAIVRLTSSAICGTDLHFVRGTMPGVEPGTILGHEGVGVVEEVGDDVRNFRPGDRVVICSTIACGYCSYCRAGWYSQCDVANPNGPGTAFFGGPVSAGGFDGLQAELARIPHAATTMVRLPDDIDDDTAITLSDILPTGYFGADMARIHPGRSVAIFGCGPVGQFAIASAFLMGAGRVFAIDSVDSRLDIAADQGAEVIDFGQEDPVQTLRDLTGGIGPDRVIDAVGVEAEQAGDGQDRGRYARELEEIAPERAEGPRWQPGNAPTRAIEWAVEAVAKAGTISVVGVYPPSVRWFPLGPAMMKNLQVHMGNCPHRRYVPELIEMVRSGRLDPAAILSEIEPLSSAIEAFEAFDERRPGWLKVELQVGS
jgi:threonine dehydrogenase-like Zn-dependent dehydrogenase